MGWLPWGGSWKPQLGLDLEGGTRITLSAIEEGGAVTPTKLKQAASIVDRRVNGSGVSEAEVSTSGNRNIIVEIPGKNASNLVEAVQRTAQLRFRLVAGSPQPGTPAASQSPSPAPSSKATPSSKASPSGKSSKTPKANQATPKPRPAPFADPTPTPATPAPTASVPAQQDTQPQVTAKGAPVDKPLGVVAGPGHRVADEVRQVHLPEGQRRQADRGRARRAADHL